VGTASFYDYIRPDLAALVGSAPRATRLYRAVYRQRIRDFAELISPSSTDQAVARERFDLQLPVVASRFESADGTRRYLIRLRDGESVESVLIPEPHRFTFCISSQVGCSLACAFCLTGQLGLTRNLSTGEIVAQVLLLRRELSTQSPDRFSVVLMGMGEPLQNYENVLNAIEILTDDHGIGLSLRRITLSTAGLLPAIERLGRERLFPNLSVSLTGATNEIRNELMPVNRRYSIQDVIGAVRRLPENRRKRVMFEYVLIKGVTDSLEDAGRLSGLVRGLRSKVNLIPLNESPDIPYRRPDDAAILRFQQVLIENGIATFIRRNRGGDVSGACGQLKKNGMETERRMNRQ
jgi:23S rRNA (adenine2503-C2)-methyltransferase